MTTYHKPDPEPPPRPRRFMRGEGKDGSVYLDVNEPPAVGPESYLEFIPDDHDPFAAPPFPCFYLGFNDVDASKRFEARCRDSFPASRFVVERRHGMGEIDPATGKHAWPRYMVRIWTPENYALAYLPQLPPANLKDALFAGHRADAMMREDNQARRTIGPRKASAGRIESSKRKQGQFTAEVRRLRTTDPRMLKASKKDVCRKALENLKARGIEIEFTTAYRKWKW